MSEPTVPCIEVVAEHEQDIAANAVDLFIVIEGSSTFTGRSALKKAKEVASLVLALEQAGLPESAIDVESVHVALKSGLLGRSSSATYKLRLHVSELDKLPAVLGAVSGATQVTLEQLHWRYPEDAESEARLLAQTAARALVKARAIAETLGVRITGIALAQEVKQHHAEEHVVRFGVPLAAARMRSEEVDLGLQIQHHKKLKHEVRLKCSIVGEI
jgi:uncharacterized protein YggE